MLEQILLLSAEHKLISGIVLLITSWCVYKFLTTTKNLPPGPWGFPIVGYIPFLGKKPHVVIAKLTQKYGDVITIDFGFTRIIFLTSFKAIKEAFVKQADAFSARPASYVPPHAESSPGIVSGSGEMWADQRRFSLFTLRDLGLGKSSLEPQIQDEILFFIKELKSFNGQPADISKALRLSVTNIICVIMAGQRYEYDNPTMQRLLHLTEEHVESLKLATAKDFIPHKLQVPWLLNLFGINSSIQSGFEFHQIMKKVVDKFAEKHQPGSVHNFIDAWLTETERQSSKSHNLTKTHLAGVLVDLFIAGSDTTTTTLLWGVLFMILHPDVQSKVQEEIDDVIGRERTPAMADQKSMPYTEATILEISRKSSIAALSLPHRTTKDTTLQGCFIPKDSTVMPNIWAVHHDPEIFVNPYEFNPDRFLTDNQQLKKMEELIPFSMGKRQCMGESLARMELFLYFTSMLQNFVFKAVDGVDIDMEYDYALVSAPKVQNIRAVIR